MPLRAAISLDANAGASLRPEVVEALQGWLSKGINPNPSSIHSFGRQGRRLISDARESVAASLGTRIHPEQIVFTSSGTEANQLAIRAALEPALLRGEKIHWITTPVEHDASRAMVDWARDRGAAVDFLPVDSQGRPEVTALSELLRPETRLLSLIWVNNETGVLSDVESAVAVARARGVAVHLDGAQAWGKIEFDLSMLGADYVSFSAHKIGALSGTGVLFVRDRSRSVPHILGKQERGWRGGAENVLGILSVGVASRSIEVRDFSERVMPVRDRLERELLSRIPGARVHGAQAVRVANTSNLGFEGIERDGLVAALDLAGYAVSSGAACSSGVAEPSHVLLAMGYSPGQAQGAVRISLGTPLPSDEELQGFVSALERSVLKLRESGYHRLTR